MGIKNLINKAGAKVADKVAKLSALSPEQLEAVEKQKEKYLADQPNVSDEELTNRLLASCGVEVFNSYLDQIKELYLLRVLLNTRTNFIPPITFDTSILRSG